MRELSTSQPVVVCRGVELRYGSTIAVARSDVEIPGSGVTAVIGPNGSGKSTLLAAIAGLHSPGSGDISVFGKAPPRIRQRIALVPQATKVNDSLPVTVREVVGMGRYAGMGLVSRFNGADKRRVDESLELLSLNDLAHAHLHELSGGQRQRVFVAQGLAQDHDLLLLDEPLNALDLVSAEVITTAIDHKRAAGIPVVVTTHDMSAARNADHVVVMASRVVASGPPDTTLIPPIIAEAYGIPVDALDPDRLHVDDAAHHHHDERHRHVSLSDQTHDHDGPT